MKCFDRKRRVVITGLGLITPLGCGVDLNWRRLIDGESGIRLIQSFDASDMPVRIAGEVIHGNGDGEFDSEKYIIPKDLKKLGKFITYAIAAADEALKDAKWNPGTREEMEESGVSIGSGIGGLPEIYSTSVTLHTKGPSRVSPFFVPSSLINLTSGHISIRHKLLGPNHAIATACASGAHAIADAMRMIILGDANVIVAGGAESSVCSIGIAGFHSLRALAVDCEDNPQRASCPYDEKRSGFIISEGAGILVLEEMEHAIARNAHIYAELVGYGMSGDAYHMTAPEETGDGAYRAMVAALKNAEIEPEMIGYINGHGTSTPLGDLAEVNAVERLFCQEQNYGMGDRIAMSSTKSAIGHALGAAGGIEAIYCALALQNQMLLPTLNLENPISSKIDFIPVARECAFDYALSNSFGFGGTNASIVLKKWMTQ